MLTYILESSACLAIFLCFYKLLLEKENIHVFKRFYLLIAIALAFGIPLLTFNQYIETSTEILPNIIENNPAQTNTEFGINAAYDNQIPFILWSIYGLGVLISGILFYKSLLQILFNIKNNSKLENDHFTIVLLSKVVTPHTFFNYIFLNRYKFETKQIPKEVLLHEKAHAVQKHSWDILCVELLQVIFWFNPLMYILKRDIKLNHEFLADQAVLGKGVNTSTYQNVLLAFASKSQQPQLANAINYSSTKKRFIIMKKHTSKKTAWLRSMLLLPILAFLLFSFSTEVIIIEKKAIQKRTIENNVSLENKKTVESIDLENVIGEVIEKKVNQTGNTTVVPPDIGINANVDTKVKQGFATIAITELANNGAIFDYNGKQISGERAIAIAENTDFVVQRHSESNQLIVYLSESRPSKGKIKKWSRKY